MGTPFLIRNLDSPADPAAGLAVRAQLNDTQSPADVIDLLSLAAFVDGRQPFSRYAQLKHLPGGAMSRRSAVSSLVAIAGRPA